MKLPFTKMQGTGNDYVYVDGAAVRLDDPATVARLVSDRRKGVGGDGLILIQPANGSDAAHARMEMYNADGSRGLMCGNGIRCVGKYVFEHGLARENPLRIATDVGVKILDLEITGDEVTAVTVDMGEPILEPSRIPVRLDGERIVDRPLEVDDRTWNVTCLSMGNPHCVVFVPDTTSLDVARLGPPFEHHEVFPERVNTEFVEVLAKDEIRMRVWERGSGETWACGTGACAAVVAAILSGHCDRKVTVHLLGGDLDVEWREGDGHVAMRGDAVEVFRGEMELATT